MTEIPVVRIGDDAGIPILGFGTWQLRGRQAYEAVRWALDAGYRHIDTATMYKNEADVGKAIRDSGLDRGDLFITTKLPPGNAGRERSTIQQMLRLIAPTGVLERSGKSTTMHADDLILISVDDHIIEPPTTWTSRVPRKYRDRAPHVFGAPRPADHSCFYPIRNTMQGCR